MENRGGKNLRMIFLNVKKVKKFEIGSLNFELNLILENFLNTRSRIKIIVENRRRKNLRMIFLNFVKFNHFQFIFYLLRKI